MTRTLRQRGRQHSESEHDEQCERETDDADAYRARGAPIIERLANGDQRKSLQERYKDHAGYVKAVTKAARALAKDGMLLADDVQRYIDAAEASNVLR